MIQVGISRSLGLTFEDAAHALTHGSSLWMPCAPQETIRKVFPLNLGGSDTCYFCKKRVYVMERLSAEGHFFHRECFRCSVCATTLRLAAYTYDGDEGNPVPPGTALVPLEAPGCPTFPGSTVASFRKAVQEGGRELL